MTNFYLFIVNERVVSTYTDLVDNFPTWLTIRLYLTELYQKILIWTLYLRYLSIFISSGPIKLVVKYPHN